MNDNLQLLETTVAKALDQIDNMLRAMTEATQVAQDCCSTIESYTYVATFSASAVVRDRQKPCLETVG